MKIDYNAIIEIVETIHPKLELIMKETPREHDHLLKNLAAAAIHLTFFMRDLNIHAGTLIKEKNSIMEDLFIKNCGCGDEDEEKNET